MDIITDPKFVLINFAALAFIIVGHFRQEQIQEPLKQTLLQLGYIRLDWWSLSHFLFFAVLGYWFPNNLGFFFIFGIFWELLEDFLAKDTDTRLVDCSHKKNSSFAKFWCNGYQDGYWYGKADDVAVNMTGYLAGWGLHTLLR